MAAKNSERIERKLILAFSVWRKEKSQKEMNKNGNEESE